MTAGPADTVQMVSRVDPGLAERIARGEYEVDERAVAEAILRRRPSFVFVPAQAGQWAPVLVQEDEPVAGDDLA
jgi:hypothetical protein